MSSRKRRPLAALVAVLLALNAVLLLVQPGLALPNNLAGFLFGPNMVRLEAVLKVNGALHDYRVDRGKVRSNAGGSLALLERDGSVVTIPIAPAATVTLNGRSVALAGIRKGMKVTTVRDGDAPAETVQALPR